MCLCNESQQREKRELGKSCFSSLKILFCSPIGLAGGSVGE